MVSVAEWLDGSFENQNRLKTPPPPPPPTF